MSGILGFVVFFPMVSALVCYLIGKKDKKGRDYFADAATGMELAAFLLLFFLTKNSAGPSHQDLMLEIPEVCGMGLHFVLDDFRMLYGGIAALLWFSSTLFSREYFTHYRNRNRYYLFLLLTLGATEGVFLSADFYTMFLFFEMMSFTSYVWVAQDEKKASLRAAETYLAVAVIGGLVMLMEIFMIYNMTGTLVFEELAGCYQMYALTTSSGIPEKKLMIAGICLLVGFGAKAGAFPLHIWLPKAHPAAPAPASALLSGILTKAGVFGILVLTAFIFAGSVRWESIILLLGVCTMVTGAVLALFSVDLKRTLACSSVSQIGFILVGVGLSGLLDEGRWAAVEGSLLHMVNHSLIKLVLFLAAGVVFMNVHKLNLNDIRGFGRKKPLLHFIFLMGVLGIGGLPLWNGYISKTLLHEAIVMYTELIREGMPGLFDVSALKGIEWCFLVSGGLTVAYMLKLYAAVFIEKNADREIQDRFDAMNGAYMEKANGIVLASCAALLPVMGFFPNLVMGSLAKMGHGFMGVTKEGFSSVTWFSPENLKGAGISIGIGILVYLVIVRLWMMKKKDGSTVYVDRWYRRLDLENLIYRPVLLGFLPFVFGVICRVFDSLIDTVVVLLRKTLYKDSKIPHELEEGTIITHAAGSVAGGILGIANATIWRRHPKKKDYQHKYAILYEEWAEDSIIIGRSLSFGLLLFCIGLIITVIYLLL